MLDLWGNAEHPIIAIAPRSTLTWSGSTWSGPIYELNRTKQDTYAKLNFFFSVVTLSQHDNQSKATIKITLNNTKKENIIQKSLMIAVVDIWSGE